MQPVHLSGTMFSAFVMADSCHRSFRAIDLPAPVSVPSIGAQGYLPSRRERSRAPSAPQVPARPRAFRSRPPPRRSRRCAALAYQARSPSRARPPRTPGEERMDYLKRWAGVVTFMACALGALCAWAADYPAPKEGSWVARDFRFHTGEVLPELQLHYRTVGAPTGEPVLVLHGTAGTGRQHADARVRRRALRSRAAARRIALLHHHSRHPRPRKVVQALGRPAHEVSRSTTTRTWWMRITGCSPST